MVESFFIPDTLLIKHKDLLGLHVSENQVTVEHVYVEHEFTYIIQTIIDDLLGTILESIF